MGYFAVILALMPLIATGWWMLRDRRWVIKYQLSGSLFNHTLKMIKKSIE
jgi:hypothetical protein